MTWGGQYGGLLEPPTGLGWSSSGREFYKIKKEVFFFFLFFCLFVCLFVCLFALGDLGWSVLGAS